MTPPKKNFSRKKDFHISKCSVSLGNKDEAVFTTITQSCSDKNPVFISFANDWVVLFFILQSEHTFCYVVELYGYMSLLDLIKDEVSRLHGSVRGDWGLSVLGRESSVLLGDRSALGE